MLNLIRYCLLVIALVSAGSSLAADYTLPADIGNGAFSSCAGGGPVYTCNAITIGNDDTVTLSSDVTLTINGNLIIGKDVVLGIGGFVFNLDVDGNVDIDKDTVISANLTATGDLSVAKDVSFTGDIDVDGDIDIDKDAQFYGDITAGGDITIDKDGVVNGDVMAGGTLDIGNDTIVIGDCDPTHPQCIGGGGAAVCTTTQIASDGEEFLGVSGSSDSNVIAVGKDGGIYQYDGSNWSKDSFVAGEQLNDVEVVNSNLAFAVGKKGEVLEYDGANWNQLPAPVNEELFGVWAISANEVWVAGKKAALYRWDGSSWTDMSGAGQANVDNNKELLEVWGDASSFYAVEKDGDLYRYARPGGPWSKPTACSSSFNIEALDVWGDGAGNVYIGGCLLLHRICHSSHSVPEAVLRPQVAHRCKRFRRRPDIPRASMLKLLLQAVSCSRTTGHNGKDHILLDGIKTTRIAPDFSNSLLLSTLASPTADIIGPAGAIPAIQGGLLAGNPEFGGNCPDTEKTSFTGAGNWFRVCAVEYSSTSPFLPTAKARFELTTSTWFNCSPATKLSLLQLLPSY